jgi:hypothetical protein
MDKPTNSESTEKVEVNNKSAESYEQSVELTIQKKKGPHRIGNKDENPNNFANVPPHILKQLQRRGGLSKSPEKLAAVIQNLPYNKTMSAERSYAIAALQSGDYNETIKHILLTIITKAESAKEWSDLLQQLLKLPFVQKIQQDIAREKQRDVIPIVVEVLTDAGHDELVGVLYDRLLKEGWNPNGRNSVQVSAPMPEMRPVKEESEYEARRVESTDNKELITDEMQDLQPQNNSGEEER